MSKIGDWIIEKEELGELIHVEGRGYVKSEDYAHELMITKSFEDEFDKSFRSEEVEECT